jgi:uncharacterized membrane protein
MPKFCTNCGNPLTAEGVRFCNKCGAAVAPTQPQQEVTAAAAPPAYQTPPSYQPPQGYQYPQYQGQASAGGLQPNVAGLLCYVLGLITGIVFLVLDPYNKDRFVRFHAFQAIFFHVAWIVLIIASSIISSVLPWGLIFLGSLISFAVSLGGLLLWLYVMYKAYQNERFKLPVIGDLAERQAG